MQAPAQIAPQSLDDYLEVMSKSVFQSGISRKVVESKWPGLRQAFHRFDARRVAELTEPELEELTQDSRVIRSRRKLEAVVFNARRMLELEERHGSFRNYLRSHSDFKETLKDIHQQFKYMGDSGTYHFLYVVGEAVPPHDEFCATHERKRR
jgi:DNA-3-methyladenine glycosylase I